MAFAVYRLMYVCFVALLFSEVCIGLSSRCIQPKCDPSPSTLPAHQVNCKCDSECPLYGDCCLDYSLINNSLRANTSSSLQTLLECWTVDFTGDLLTRDNGDKSILMVSRCSQLSHPQNIQCINQSLFLPVTDSLSNYTFRNIYCTLCNNISEDQLVPWQPRFYCDRNTAMQLSSLSTYEKINAVCQMYKVVSKSPLISMRSCVPHISTCPVDASSQLVQNCTRGQYDLVVASNNIRMLFRNHYCAQCNGYNDTQCLQNVTSRNFFRESLSDEQMFNVTWNDIITVEIAVNCDPASGTLLEPSTNTCIPTTTTPTQTMVTRCTYSSCSDRKATSTTKGRVCYCDDQCSMYRDCCHDAKHIVQVNNIHNQLYDMLTCVRTNFESNNPQVTYAEEAYLMVSKCPKDWVTTYQQDTQTAENTVKNCTESFTMPLSDLKTIFVFRNIHCALCNNFSIEQLSPWQPQYDCNINTTLDAEKLDIKTLEDVRKLCQLEKYTPSHTARTCFPHVSSCPNQTSSNTSSTTADCSRDGLELYQQPNPTGEGYVSLFRNRHCAVCNDVRDISCFVPNVIQSNNHIGGPDDGPAGFSFNTFLDVTGSGSVTVQVVLTTTVTCKLNEVFDSDIRKCRNSFQPPDVIIPPLNCTNNMTTDNCTSLVPLNSSEYQTTNNSCTLLYRGKEVDIITHDKLDRPVICTNFTRKGVVEENVTRIETPLPFIIMTYITTSISIVGSIAILLTYTIFKQLRTLPSKILMNLAAAFLAGDLIILLYGVLSASLSDSLPVELTATMAILLHFFFLCRFSWMSLLGFETCRIFNLALKLQSDISNKAKSILLVIYMIIGWGLPLAITVITIIVNYASDGLVLYGETSDGSAGNPWINHPTSAVIAFICPAVLALLFNAVVFATSFVLLYKAAGSIRSVKKHVRIIGALFTAMGLTWLFGLIALIPGQSWAWYPFIILNSTQSIWIAVMFLLTKKIMKLYLSLFNCSRLTDLYSTKKTTIKSKVSRKMKHASGNTDSQEM